MGAGPTDPRVVTFDRLDSGEFVALLTHRHRTVAAIVHPPAPVASLPTLRWSLAGDLAERSARPKGEAQDVRTACAEAAQALGVELDVEVRGWEVTQ